MENNYSAQESNKNDLALTSMSCEFLRETARWAKFLAIMGFIGIVFMVLAAIFVGAFMSMMPSMTHQNTPFPFPPALLSVIYIVFAAVYACPVYFLYKFSVNTKDAIDSMNTNLLEEGLSYLKSHYKFVGIMTIVIMSLYVLFIIGAIVSIFFFTMQPPVITTH